MIGLKGQQHGRPGLVRSGADDLKADGECVDGVVRKTSISDVEAANAAREEYHKVHPTSCVFRRRPLVVV